MILRVVVLIAGKDRDGFPPRASMQIAIVAIMGVVAYEVVEIRMITHREML